MTQRPQIPVKSTLLGNRPMCPGDVVDVSYIPVSLDANNSIVRHSDGLWAPVTLLPPLNIQTIVSTLTATLDFINDMLVISAQSVPLSVANPTGTPLDGHRFLLRIHDDGTSRAISFGSAWRPVDAPFPTATKPGQWLYLEAIYNATSATVDITDTPTSEVGTIQPLGGAIRRLLVDKINGTLDLRDFIGADPTGATNSDVAFAWAHTAALAVGGLLVRLGTATYTVGTPVALCAGLIYQGDGPNASCIRLANGANCDVIKTDGFDALTGQNKWLISDGVPDGFGLRDLRIDGNRTNNATGFGCRIYGKRYVINTVIITECAETGFYSEAGDAGGQVDPWRDQPESSIVNLHVRGCGKKGFWFRGPHDAYIDQLYASSSGEECVRIERLAATYSGQCDFGHIHAYGGGPGFSCFYANANLRGIKLTAESSQGTNVTLDTATNISISSINSFQSSKGTLLPAVVLNAPKAIIGALSIQDSHGGGGLLVSPGASGSIVNGINIDGKLQDTTCAAVQVNCSDIILRGKIAGYADPSVSVNTVTGLLYTLGNNNEIDLRISDCKVCWNNIPVTALRNQMTIKGQDNMTGFIGQPKTDDSSQWDFYNIDNAATVTRSKKAFQSGVNFIIGTAGTKVHPIPHGLMYTPPISNIRLTLSSPPATSNWVGTWCITAVDATNITVSMYVGTPSTTNTDTILFNVSSEI